MVPTGERHRMFLVRGLVWPGLGGSRGESDPKPGKAQLARTIVNIERTKELLRNRCRFKIGGLRKTPRATARRANP